MEKVRPENKYYMLIIFIVWLLIEEKVRNALFFNDEVLFVVDTVPIALYSLIGYILFCIIYFFYDSKTCVLKKYYCFFITLIFVVPAIFIPVRTEIKGDIVCTYGMFNTIQYEYTFDEIDNVELKLEYYENSPSLTQFKYKINFDEYAIDLLSTNSSRFWNNILLLDEKMYVSGVDRKVSGTESIERIKEYKLYDKWKNLLFGVCSNIDIIEYMFDKV